MKRSRVSKTGDGLTACFKLWVSSGNTDGTFGDGRMRLLEAIDSEGSLQAAAEKLNISYRKAWGDLKKTEASLGVQLIERHRGGKGGGEMSLTNAGRRWVKAYASFHADTEKYIDKAFKKFLNKTCGGDSNGLE